MSLGVARVREQNEPCGWESGEAGHNREAVILPALASVSVQERKAGKPPQRLQTVEVAA